MDLTCQLIPSDIQEATEQMNRILINRKACSQDEKFIPRNKGHKIKINMAEKQIHVLKVPTKEFSCNKYRWQRDGNSEKLWRLIIVPHFELLDCESKGKEIKALIKNERKHLFTDGRLTNCWAKVKTHSCIHRQNQWLWPNSDLKYKMKMNSQSENKQLTKNRLPTEKGSDQNKICFQSSESTEWTRIFQLLRKMAWSWIF